MKTSISIVAATLVAVTAMTTTLSAEDAKPKRSLKGNMTLKYNELPGEAKTFEEMFSKGIFYGRLRVNDFRWDYNNERAGSTKDNEATGIGGSLVFKSAAFKGIGVNLGMYYTRAVDVLDQSDANRHKAGKDTFSRAKYLATGDTTLMSLAEANIYFKAGKSKLKVGQQIFESVFTKSNDTKMIPNTFMGAVLTNKSIEGTKLTLAHFTAQKLRDHESNHDLITYNDPASALKESWSNNDDSAVHKGLTYQNFQAAGKDVDHTLSIASVKSKIGKNLKTEVSYLTVPDVVNNLTLEAHYTIKAGDTKIIPGFRYMMQSDNGGGVIGGASLKGDVTAANFSTLGYKQGESLDSSLLCARIDIKPGGMFKYRLGYSKVADEADIVAPWRGFPTGGFTRAMAQYNWYANTETIMARIDGKINKTFSFLVRYAIQDFDDDKSSVQADTNIIHSDLKFNLNSVTPGLAGKIRIGLISDEGSEAAGKNDDSYNEYRFELNYLF